MRGNGVRAEVGEAIEELKRAFPGSEVTVSEDGQGGAHVMVENVAIGERYQPEQSWLGATFPPSILMPTSIRCSWTTR